MAKTNVYYGTGKRKTSVAKVKLVPGKGKITVNGKDVNEYLPYETLVMDLTQPLDITNTREIFDVVVEVRGGGFSGQLPQRFKDLLLGYEYHIQQVVFLPFPRFNL